MTIRAAGPPTSSPTAGAGTGTARPAAQPSQPTVSSFAAVLQGPAAPAQAQSEETMGEAAPADQPPPAAAAPFSLPQGTARPATSPGSFASSPLDADPAPKPRRDARREQDAGDALDPMARQAAQLAPPPTLLPPQSPGAGPQLQARASLEEVLPALVRRVAWSGDGKKGTVRLELGAGRLEGATLLVHAEDGRVRVELSAPAGVDAESWRQRIVSRLQLRGVQVDSVQVD